MVLTQLACSWRFAAFEPLRTLIGSVYRRDGLVLAAPEIPSAASPRTSSSPGAGSRVGGADNPVAPGTPAPCAPPQGVAPPPLLGRAAAAALAAAGRQVMPELLGGAELGLGAGAVAKPAAAPFSPAGGRGFRTGAVVAALTLELEEESSGDDGESAANQMRQEEVAAAVVEEEGDVWRRVWSEGSGLVLVTHDEDASSKYNPLEVEVVRLIAQVRVGDWWERWGGVGWGGVRESRVQRG